MLSSAQALIDDALELAALIVAHADGKVGKFADDPLFDPKRIEYVARGIISQKRLVGLASYLLDPAMRDGKPTRSGLVRSISDYFGEQA